MQNKASKDISNTDINATVQHKYKEENAHDIRYLKKFN